MKIKQVFVVFIASIVFWGVASASLQYDQVITAIFGAGNPNTGWTVSSDQGVTVALRAKNRENGSTANINGVYSEPAGFLPGNTRAKWNFEWSVDSGLVNLDNYDVYLAIDNDPSVGINYTVVNTALIPDNSFGNSLTLNGQGVEGPWATYAPVYSIVQQSHNLTFYPSLGFDPNANATYEFELFVVPAGADPNDEPVASVEITVVVGSGGQTVQDLIDAIGQDFEGTHGEYVAEVTALLKDLHEDGVIDKAERKQLHVAAAKSDIGK